jgi:hypothetical protein
MRQRMVVPKPRRIAGSWLGLGQYFNNNLEGSSCLQSFWYGGGGLEREQEALSRTIYLISKCKKDPFKGCVGNAVNSTTRVFSPPIANIRRCAEVLIFHNLGCG